MRTFSPRIIHLLLPLLLMACYAGTRGSVVLIKAEKKLAEARNAGAPERATYAWTLANEYMKKARDEYSHSDFEAAEALVKKAEKWAAEAAKIAAAAPPEPEPDPVPEPSGWDATPAAEGDEGVWK